MLQRRGFEGSRHPILQNFQVLVPLFYNRLRGSRHPTFHSTSRHGFPHCTVVCNDVLVPKSSY